jgi:periplasmic protein TonB
MGIAGIRLALTTMAALCIASHAQAQQFVPGPDPLMRGGAAATPSEDPANWLSAKDYPKEALAERAAGTVAFRLRIDSDGGVSDCTVTKSSGFVSLDRTTCKLLSRRARFLGARDSNNEPVAAMWSSAVSWAGPQSVVTQ